MSKGSCWLVCKMMVSHRKKPKPQCLKIAQCVRTLTCKNADMHDCIPDLQAEWPLNLANFTSETHLPIKRFCFLKYPWPQPWLPELGRKAICLAGFVH